MSNGHLPCNGLSEFYDGKSIFITGSSGYLGSALLEILLRCFPGILNIYILLREKKNVKPETRKKIIFQKRIFSTLLKDKPYIIDKVHTVQGDINHTNLGISDDDFQKIVEDVRIVFHCAASVSFIKPLRSIIWQNAMGTHNVVEVCRKLKKLDALIYTSTAFSNCNYYPYIEEKVYRLPFPADKFLNEMQNGNDESIDLLVAKCKPDWPNSYTFSKCLAENVLLDKASDLPVAIIRPSIIVSSWKGILPGYTEEGNGMIDFAVSMGKGYIRVTHGNPDTCLDFIPVDIVVNTHIIAAWTIANTRLPAPFVVNCTGRHLWKVPYGEYIQMVVDFCRQNILPMSFAIPSVHVTNNKFFYWLYAIYAHYVPAVFVDLMLRFKGKKPRMVSSYMLLDRVMQSMSFFFKHQFEFEVNRFNYLSEQIDPKDKELIYMDFDGVNTWDMFTNTKTSCTFYEWERDEKGIENRRKTVLMQTMFINFLKRAVLCMFCLLMYFVIVKVFYFCKR